VSFNKRSLPLLSFNYSILSLSLISSFLYPFFFCPFTSTAAALFSYLLHTSLPFLIPILLLPFFTFTLTVLKKQPERCIVFYFINKVITVVNVVYEIIAINAEECLFNEHKIPEPVFVNV
jgi:hypothetical protein